MPNELTDISIEEISLCNKGANPHAKAILVKSMGEDGEELEAKDFNAAMNSMNAKEYAEELLEAVKTPVEALCIVVRSILDDETIDDPEAALNEELNKFKEYMAGIVPEAMEKAISKSVTKAINAGSASDVQPDQRGHKMSEDVTKALEAANAEIAVLKDAIAKSFSADEADFMAKMDGEAKDKFKGMTPEERKKMMEKGCGKVTKMDDLPEDIRKAMADAEAERVEMRKQLDAMKAEREYETFKKKASDCGLASDAAKHLQVIAKASPDALDFVEKLAKAVKEVEKRSPLFKELGSDKGVDTSTANAQLVAKAHEIVNTENVSFAKAFTDACNRHPDLYKAYCAESRS